MKKVQKQSNCHNGNFKKTSIFYSFFHHINSSNFGLFFGHFVYNMTNYNCTKYHHLKRIILSGFMQRDTLCPPPVAREGNSKKPVAGRIKKNTRGAVSFSSL